MAFLWNVIRRVTRVKLVAGPPEAPAPPPATAWPGVMKPKTWRLPPEKERYVRG